MGIFDFFKGRRQRESAIPGGLPGADAEASMSALDQATVAQGAATGGKFGLSGDFAADMARLQQILSTHQVDLRSQPMELREAIAKDLQARGIDAKVGGELTITDPNQIEAVLETLQKHGLLPAIDINVEGSTD